MSVPFVLKVVYDYDLNSYVLRAFGSVDDCLLVVANNERLIGNLSIITGCTLSSGKDNDLVENAWRLSTLVKRPIYEEINLSYDYDDGQIINAYGHISSVKTDYSVIPSSYRSNYLNVIVHEFYPISGKLVGLGVTKYLKLTPTEPFNGSGEFVFDDNPKLIIFDAVTGSVVGLTSEHLRLLNKTRYEMITYFKDSLIRQSLN